MLKALGLNPHSAHCRVAQLGYRWHAQVSADRTHPPAGAALPDHRERSFVLSVRPICRRSSNNSFNWAPAVCGGADVFGRWSGEGVDD